MSKQGIIKRYSLIIKKVTEDHYPDLKKIQIYLAQKGFEVSIRTIERDIKELEDEFGLRIPHSKEYGGRYVVKEDELQLEPFLHLLNIFETAELLKESLSESKETLKFISFDSNPKHQGTEWLKPILESLRDCQVLEFDYQTYFEGPYKKFEIQPYLLKEYLGRWYLVGCFETHPQLYVMGLDRIYDLQKIAKKFKRDSTLNPEGKFRDVIGVTTACHEKQKVVLSFSPDQAKYIKSLPLHRSQRVIIEDERECRIELNLSPNYELQQKILMHGCEVKVIEPKWLAEDIKEILEAAIKGY